jgi:dTDP-glucose 4,6-dehydratase
MSTLRPFPEAHVVVTGGAGFLGSHLCERFLAEGARVTAVDNLLTGRRRNVAHLMDDARFALLERDITDHLDIDGDVDVIMHFASPASPIDYLKLPIQTLKVGALGTHNMLGLALAKGARFLIASTSEVYGDPQVHPQPESYWGHVNPIGPRGVYDEAKRFAEAITFAYHRTHGVDIRVARIFNTYGPRMRMNDGRAVPAFMGQALDGVPLTIHGDGAQTRSLSYVDDMIDGFVALLTHDEPGPVNLGSPFEVTMLELAEAVQDACGAHPGIAFHPRPVDDPQVRRPDASLAHRALGWQATTPLAEGLARTAEWWQKARADGWEDED